MQAFTTAPVDQLTEPSVLAARDLILEQMKWARQYTMTLIESVPQDKWFVIAGESRSCVAWQVGHIAVAQYGLMLFRQRGRAEGDLDLLPGWLRKGFGKGSDPSAVKEITQATPEVLLGLLNSIHQQCLLEVPTFTYASLVEPTDMPFAAYPIKLGALLFCPIHEGIHAGQLGVLRRLHGLDPLR